MHAQIYVNILSTESEIANEPTGSLPFPLPNYSPYDGKELERQASQRFGTIPRVTKIHDPRSDSHEAHEKR